MSGRNWCFTINNPELTDYPEQWPVTHLKTILYQVEMGEEETLHLQGYLEIDSPRAIGWLKGLNGRAHWERRKGTRSQAILYCCKEDSRLVRPRLWTSRDLSWEDLDPDSLTSCLNSRGITLATSESGNCGTNSRLLEIKEKLSERSSSIEEIADEHFDLWNRGMGSVKYTFSMDLPEPGSPSGQWTNIREHIGSKEVNGGMDTSGMRPSLSTNTTGGCHSTCCYDCATGTRCLLKVREASSSLLQKPLFLLLTSVLISGITATVVIFLHLKEE